MTYEISVIQIEKEFGKRFEQNCKIKIHASMLDEYRKELIKTHNAINVFFFLKELSN